MAGKIALNKWKKKKPQKETPQKKSSVRMVSPKSAIQITLKKREGWTLSNVRERIK